jgi:hypothetical protein
MAPFNIDAPEWGFLIIFLAERFIRRANQWKPARIMKIKKYKKKMMY